MRRNILIALFLAGITLALYWPAGQYDLIYFDDPLFVTESPEINSGITAHSLAWAATTVVAANWHPVTNLSFLLTHQFWGTSPGVEHRVNIALHAINVALLFLLLVSMTRATGRSALMAALFAWHPLRVESVAWIAERKDVLSGFFFLLTLLAYQAWAERKAQSAKGEAQGAKRYYWLAVGLFAVGLMCKAMLVTMPLALLLLDVWPLNRVGKPETVNPMAFYLLRLKTLALEKWPFFAITFGFCLLTFWVQQTHAAVSSLDRTGWDMRLGNVILSYVRYLGNTVWPVDLAVFYPFPTNVNSFLALWPGWEILLVAAGLLAASVGCVWQLARRPYLAFGWFWYVGMILPVIGLVQVGGQGMADRYTYLPMIGPVVAAVWWVAEILPSLLRRTAVGRLPVFCQFALIWIIPAALFWATRQQLAYWQNTVTLFTHTIDVTGENHMAQLTLGYGYEHAGRMSEAMEHYRVAIAIDPKDKQAYLALARLQEQGQTWMDAAETYESALNIDPNEITAHLGLANVLPHLGRNAEALNELQTALGENSNSPEIMNNLAWMLATYPDKSFRDGQRAVTLAELACELTQFKATVYIGTLAAAQAEAGRFEEAIATAQRACTNAATLGEINLLKANQDLLEVYRRHEAWHQEKAGY